MSRVISLSHLSYSISGVDILKQLNLEINTGQYFAIAGVNGAGKSTLIKLILDLLRPSNDGVVDIFGLSNRDPRCREKLVYLPERFDVKRSVTGWQYLVFISSIYGRQLDRAMVSDLAEKLDFSGGRLDSSVASYSKGMVQKLGLISCFMLDREILILDEPLSGLDPRARYYFKELMLAERSKNRTIFYSTHMLADVEELCDHFGILHKGDLQFVGTPDECRIKYGGESLEQAYINCIDR